MADLVRFKYTDGTKTITPTNLNAGDLILDTSNRKLYIRCESSRYFDIGII